jgi:hypothetical protein
MVMSLQKSPSLPEVIAALTSKGPGPSLAACVSTAQQLYPSQAAALQVFLSTCDENVDVFSKRMVASFSESFQAQDNSEVIKASKYQVYMYLAYARPHIHVVHTSIHTYVHTYIQLVHCAIVKCATSHLLKKRHKIRI